MRQVVRPGFSERSIRIGGWALAALLAIAGCSRSFPAPSTSAHVDGLFLNGTGPLVDAAPIAAVGADGNPAQLQIRGSSLSLARGVLVDGATVQVITSTDSAITFLAPDPGQVQVGVPVTITLSDANGDRSVGRLRFYVPPSMDSLPTPVVAPGQLVITGSGFSPVAEENQLTVDGAATQPSVVLAASDHLLVTLPAGLPEGRNVMTLSISPKNGQLDRPLTYARRPLIWRVIPAFWNDPPQAFSNSEVRFRPPKEDGGTLYDDLDNILQQQSALDTLDVPAFDATLSAGNTTGTGTTNGNQNGAVSTGGPGGGPASTTGSNSGATSGNFTGSTTGSNGTQNTTGTGSASGIDLDAGSLSANYPPDDSDAGDYVPPSQDLPLSSSGEVPAHSGLSVARDGIDTGATPLINLDTNELSWVVPHGTPVGAHLIALSNPAGTSPYAPLTILPGHLPAPSLSCFPLGPGTALAPLPRAMHSHDTQGEVLLPTLDGQGMLSVIVVHPGGAVETEPVPNMSNATPVHAGRDLLYVTGAATSTELGMTAVQAKAGGAVFSQTGLLPGPVLDVLEPNSRELFTWTLVNGPSTYLTDWNGDVVTLSNDGSSGFNCAVQSGALDPAHATLAAACNGTFWLGQADTPTALIGSEMHRLVRHPRPLERQRDAPGAARRSDGVPGRDQRLVGAARRSRDGTRGGCGTGRDGARASDRAVARRAAAPARPRRRGGHRAPEQFGLGEPGRLRLAGQGAGGHLRRVGQPGGRALRRGRRQRLLRAALTTPPLHRSPVLQTFSVAPTLHRSNALTLQRSPFLQAPLGPARLTPPRPRSR